MCDHKIKIIVLVGKAAVRWRREYGKMQPRHAKTPYHLLLLGISIGYSLILVPAFLIERSSCPAFRRTTTADLIHHRLLVRKASAASSSYEFALLFDCDGVILETEELHRLAYNEAFRKFDLKIDGVPLSWSVRALWLAGG
jgi:hypothetical protein